MKLCAVLRSWRKMRLRMLIGIHEACKVSHLPQTWFGLCNWGEKHQSVKILNCQTKRKTCKNNMHYYVINIWCKTMLYESHDPHPRDLNKVYFRTFISPWWQFIPVKLSPRVTDGSELSVSRCTSRPISMWQHQNSVWEEKVTQIPLMHNSWYSYTLEVLRRIRQSGDGMRRLYS